jgi:hypothetical protein
MHQRSRLDCGQSEGEFLCLKLQLKFQTQAIKDEKYFVFAYTMRARERRRYLRCSRRGSRHTGRSGRANIASLATTCAPTVDQMRNQGGIASPSTSYLPLKDEIINYVITCHRLSLIRDEQDTMGLPLPRLNRNHDPLNRHQVHHVCIAFHSGRDRRVFDIIPAFDIIIPCQTIEGEASTQSWHPT